MPQTPPLRDDQLLALATDERLSDTQRAAVMAQLTRQQRTRITQLLEAQEAESQVTVFDTLRRAAEVAGDIGIGAAKGLGTSVVGMSELAAMPMRFVPGMRQLVQPPERFQEARQILQPQGTAQQVGFGAEQIGEVVLPGGAISRLRGAATRMLTPRLGRQAARVVGRTGVEAGSAAALSQIQQGDLERSGQAAAIAGAIPVVGGVARRSARSLTPVLRRAAQTDIEQSLVPRGAESKVITERIAPSVVRRIRGGEKALRGSNEKILLRARKRLADLTRQKRKVLRGPVGSETVNTKEITGALEEAKNAFRVPSRRGRTMVSAPTPILDQITNLQMFVKKQGPRMEIRRAEAIRKIFDRVANLGRQHTTKTALDETRAQANKIGADAVRQLLNQRPSLAQLNGEIHFWSGLKQVLSASERSQVGQQRQLFSAGVGGAALALLGAGQLAGPEFGRAGTGAGLGLFVGVHLGRKIIQLLRSPRWQRVVSKKKDQLAQALISGEPGRIQSALARIGAVEGPRVAGGL